MAGVAKPDISNLKNEMTEYEIISYKGMNTSSGCHPKYLFDGVLDSAINWTHTWSWNRMFINDITAILVIKFNKPCKIYRHGSKGSISNLSITPADNIIQHKLSAIDGWQLFCEITKPGTYSFSTINYGSTYYRTDEEWYLEEDIKFSDKIKNAVVQTIKDNELIKTVLPTGEVE